MMRKSKRKNKKFYNVDFIRFIFSVFIVYYHILHNNIFSATGTESEFLTELANECSYASFIVECFFIIAGYFLFKSYNKNPGLSVKEFAYNKFARLWPVLFVSIAIGVIFFGNKEMPAFFNVLFLQCIGVTKDYAGITWYVSPFFWTILFYFVLMKCIKDKKKCNILIGVISFFSYTFLVNNYFGRETLYSVFSLGLLRALGGIGTGYLIAVCLDSIKNLQSVKSFKPNGFQKFLIFIIFSLLEAGSFAMLMRHFFIKSRAYSNQFFVVIMFTLLFVCLLSGKGIFSLIFNNKFFGFFGRFSYSIYIMQMVSFWILGDTLWNDLGYVENDSLRCLAVSVAFSVVLGIVAYYVVELPSAALLKRFGKKVFAKPEK